jgi:hypothetical protein
MDLRAVYSPKWLKGLTMSADWWHIDMRSIVSSLGARSSSRTLLVPDRCNVADTFPVNGPVNLVIDLAKILLVQSSGVWIMNSSISWIRQASAE